MEDNINADITDDARCYIFQPMPKGLKDMKQESCNLFSVFCVVGAQKIMAIRGSRVALDRHAQLQQQFGGGQVVGHNGPLKRNATVLCLVVLLLWFVC